MAMILFILYTASISRDQSASQHHFLYLYEYFPVIFRFSFHEY